MVHEISRREVLNNLVQFKESLSKSRQSAGSSQNGEKGARVYNVLLNRKTGDMRFSQKISAFEPHIARKGMKKERAEDWKQIRIIVEQKTPQEAPHFEIKDTVNRPLKSADIDSLAWRIASETLDFLNEKGREIKGKEGNQLAEELILQDLSSIQLSPQVKQIEETPGWKGSLSRIEAEGILEGKKVGTYLLREGDEITISIAFHFSEENLFSVHPYVLTVVEEEKKISDILLLQTNKGWIQYHDDPNLKDTAIYHYYPSVEALLHSLKKVAVQPLF